MPGDRPGEGRTWLGATGVLVAAAGLLWTAGPTGLLAGGVVAVLWYLLPGAHAVALGHVLAIAVLPEPTVGGLVALEAGFVGIVAAPFVADRGWPVSLAATTLATLGIGAVAWFGWRAWQPRWLSGLAVVGLVAVGLYGLHRYAVVRLELRGAEPRA